jgi:hypothetical protein
MKMDRTVTEVVAVGLLGLTSAPVMAGHTAGIFDTPVKDNPPLVLAQESPAQERHEQHRYDEQVRVDQHSAKETAMNHNKHHHSHHKNHVQSVPEGNNNNGHDSH